MSEHDRRKVLEALARAGASGLTQTQIYSDVFGRNRTRAELEALLTALAVEEPIIREVERNGSADRPITRWRMQEANASVRPNVVPEEGDWTRSAAADGWVRWKDVVFIAEAGVPRGPALRLGRKLQQGAKRTVLSPEQRGIQHVVREALRRAVRSGYIERRGDWARLARDPVTSPRPWMDAVFTLLGEAHPTLTGRWYPKPPKTLRSVLEEHAGRQLLPEEFVRRRKGAPPGSWDPADIEVRTRLRRPATAEGLEAFVAAWKERQQQAAPPVQGWRPMRVQLPSRRGRGRFRT
jgi:hypothetical protein